MKMRKKKRLRQAALSDSSFNISIEDKEKILSAVKKMMTREWLEATAQRLSWKLQSLSEREPNCAS